MNLLNATSMAAGFTVGLRIDGREWLVVVVKGTFSIPSGNQEPTLAPQQAPLVDADIHTGEPGLSACLYESEYAPIKPRCDVLLNGGAYTPGGRPAQRVPVALRVAGITKSFQVVGDRVWQRGLAGLTPSEPQFFTVMPISYGNAFGGIDAGDDKKPRYYPTNHVGLGYHHHLDVDKVVGTPLPNTEELNNPVTNPRGEYQPMAFGPIGRAWQQRAQFAGTYDQKWIDTVCPFLPADFKDDYFQTAPRDQQIPYPQGGEEIALANLSKDGQVRFRLPKMDVPIHFRLNNRDDERAQGVIDTVIIEPDAARFMVVWRAHVELRRDIFEVAQVVVGTMPRGWQLAQTSGKLYYPSLSALTPDAVEVAAGETE